MTHLPLKRYTVTWLRSTSDGTGSVSVNDEVLADHIDCSDGVVAFTKRNGDVVAIYTVPVRVWRELP